LAFDFGVLEIAIECQVLGEGHQFIECYYKIGYDSNLFVSIELLGVNMFIQFHPRSYLDFELLCVY